jgi:hypothetical protein
MKVTINTVHKLFDILALSVPDEGCFRNVALSVPDGGCFRNVSCALFLIFMFTLAKNSIIHERSNIFIAFIFAYLFLCSKIF